MECRLCGKFQDFGSVLNPDVFGNIFRIDLKSAGLFCYQKTGIKFQVTGPVVIVYCPEFWSDHLKEIPGSKHEIIGPLFNIKNYEQSTANVILKFQSSHHSEAFEFMEIIVRGNEVDIFLEVKEENTKEIVWDTILTRGDIKDFSRSVDQLREKDGAFSPLEHFVDKHRKALIERLSYVDPVLDDLLAQNLLTQEQYDNILRREPHQEKMRQLYQYTTSWGNPDKEKLYQAILRCNKPLVIDLEGP